MQAHNEAHCPCADSGQNAGMQSSTGSCPLALSVLPRKEWLSGDALEGLVEIVPVHDIAALEVTLEGIFYASLVKVAKLMFQRTLRINRTYSKLDVQRRPGRG